MCLFARYSDRYRLVRTTRSKFSRDERVSPPLARVVQFLGRSWPRRWLVVADSGAVVPASGSRASFARPLARPRFLDAFVLTPGASPRSCIDYQHFVGHHRLVGVSFGHAPCDREANGHVAMTGADLGIAWPESVDLSAHVRAEIWFVLGQLSSEPAPGPTDGVCRWRSERLTPVSLAHPHRSSRYARELQMFGAFIMQLVIRRCVTIAPPRGCLARSKLFRTGVS